MEHIGAWRWLVEILIWGFVVGMYSQRLLNLVGFPYDEVFDSWKEGLEFWRWGIWEFNLNSSSINFGTTITPFGAIMLMQRPNSLSTYWYFFVWLYEWSF